MTRTEGKPLGTAAALAVELRRLEAEAKELSMLAGSTQTEVNRLRQAEQQATSKLDELRRDPAAQSTAVLAASDEHALALEQRVTMEGQLAALRSKRTLVDRISQVVREAADAASAAPTTMEAVAPVVDDASTLQAVVDAQEAERRRLARRVHDGPAQMLSNIVLQAEISERLFDVDPGRSRTELAGLRAQVNKTLQELRLFIFELRPMILDDLGLVPTFRRYVQTLAEKHGTHIELSSTGRDRRLPADDEVAIFRLLQDVLVERIERGRASKVTLGLNWKDDELAAFVQSDGAPLASEGDQASGLRRGERVELLGATVAQEQNLRGDFVFDVRIPLRALPSIA